MMKFYTNARNVQIVIALLKAHGIRKIIASPGTTNIAFVGSMQQDPFFEIYSSADERSAAYMACGLAAESGEPVVLSCTGATASRNYMPALTEAYYRKLPVLAITSAQHTGYIGMNIPQIIDRRVLPHDIARISVQLPSVHTSEDEWACIVQVNRAILELRRAGGGPVHINLDMSCHKDFSVKKLPETRVIKRIYPADRFPEIPKGKIGIFSGAHQKWNEELVRAVDAFCGEYDAVVFCDHTSNYQGKYQILSPLMFSQIQGDSRNRPEILIHLGEISGDYSFSAINHAEVWRISPDGELRDTFHNLKFVFEMNEIEFFKHYTRDILSAQRKEYWTTCRKHLEQLYTLMPEVPFSNIWIAARIAPKIPEGAVIHLGILNSLRAWNFFEIPSTVLAYSNTGGFGIDGCVSSLIGASLANKQKLYFGVFGDLAFFYDMNSLGNRHVQNNVRILLVNNGKGTEFRNFNHPGSAFGDEADAYIAAGGHYGNKSRELVRHYSQDLGFEYLCASNKEEFEQVYRRFLMPELTEKPLLFEIFTDSRDESDALEQVMNIEETVEGQAKMLAKQVLGKKGVDMLKKVWGR